MLMIKIAKFADIYPQVHLPAKIVMAVTQKPEGGYNLITLEWYMRTSIQPPMMAVSIGHNRFSWECLQKNRWFNLVFPSPEMRTLLNYAGLTSGKDTDKFVEMKVEFIKGKLQKLPILKDAFAVFECEVVTQIRTGDHTIFVGQVHYTWHNAENDFFYFNV